MKKLILFLTPLFFLNNGFAQNDVAGSSDPALISRFPDSWIVQYSQKDYEPYTIALDNTYPKGKYEVIEGALTSIDYELPLGKSQLELHKNYETALRKKNFKILYSCYQEDCNPIPGTFPSVVYSLYQKKKLPKLAKGGGTYIKNNATYIVAEKQVDGQRTNIVFMSGFANHANVYRLDIIQSKALELGKVTVNDIESRLEEIGKIALYDILFDFNKSTIRQESRETIDAIAAYLKKKPKVSVYVVGHTDNQGSLDFNLKLSQDRAVAVVNELVEKYKIDKRRLTPEGVAMLSPVSSNSSEEGRKLNRRVELVKE